MRSLKSILVATNLTTANRQLMETLENLAWCFGARLTVLHVQPTHISGMLDDYCQELESKMTEQIARQLADAHAAIGDVMVEVGSPAAVILRKAHAMDADLIALSTGDTNHRVGPIAQAVMEHASQPVLAVRPEGHDAKIQKLLCPVDMSDSSLRALRNAARLARGLAAQLHVLTVVPEVNWLTAAEQSGQLIHPREAYARRWSERFHHFLREVDLEGLTWVREVREGKPEQEICESAREYRADLIVMGTVGLSAEMRISMGSTTRRVLHRLPCSLLTVKYEDVLSADYEGAVEEIRSLLEQAQQAIEARDDEWAVSKFDAVLRLNPFHIPALTGRALACDRMGDVERAERCRRRLAQLQRYPVLTK